MGNTVQSLRNSIHNAVANKVLGNEDLLDLLLIAWLSRGHVLVEGPTGTGKTRAAKTMAHLLAKTFRRIQFTSDLTPASLVGVKTITSDGIPSFNRGPIFADCVLAAEINQASPQLQAVLLDAMEERQVSIDNDTFELSPEFFVIASQTSYDAENYFKLTTAQADRFMFKLVLDHLDAETNAEVIKASLTEETLPAMDGLQAFDSDRDLLDEQIRKVRVGDSTIELITGMIERLNDHPFVEAGVSVRGGIALSKSIRVIAALAGRDFVLPDDVNVLALPVFRHRIRLTPEAIEAGKTEEEIIEEILLPGL